MVATNETEPRSSALRARGNCQAGGTESHTVPCRPSQNLETIAVKMMSASWPDADDPNAQLLASVLPPRPTSLGARVRAGLEDLWSSRGAPAYAWLCSRQPWLRWAFVGVATLGPVLGLAQRVASRAATRSTHALAPARVGSSVPIAAASMLPGAAAAPRAALTEARTANAVEASAGSLAPPAVAPVLAPSAAERSAPALDSAERTADKPKKKSKSRASHRASKASTRHHRAKAGSSDVPRS